MSKSAESRETSQMQQTPTWTDRQKSCIEYPGDRLLISGPPGTGKTLVLLKRACRFSQTAPSARILVMTFNKALARYAEEQLRLNGAGSAATATHFHRWAYRQVLHVLGHPPQLIAEADRIALVRHLVEDSRSQQTQQNGQQTTPTHFTRTGTKMPTVLTRSTDWWRDEIDWIKGNALLTWDQYRQVERVGRGQGLRVASRACVWRIYTSYQEELARRGVLDYRDFALILLHAWLPASLEFPASPSTPSEVLTAQDAGNLGNSGERAGEKTEVHNAPPPAALVDHLLIDEAQDLHPAELRVLSSLAQVSLTVAADRSQKIYPTAFAWRDLGFEFQGGRRSQTLTKSYRTTRQVAQLAASLRRHDPLVRPGDPDFVEEELPDREGVPPVVIATRDTQHEAFLVVQLLRWLYAPPTPQAPNVSQRPQTHERTSLSLAFVEGDEQGEQNEQNEQNEEASQGGVTLQHRLQALLQPSSQFAPITQSIQTIGVLARTWETLRRLEPALRRQQLSYSFLREEGALDLPSGPGVLLSTFHSAKGLEFDAVLLVGLSEGLFPPPFGRTLETAEGEQEEELLSVERRLLYVAMTRTRGPLYFLHGRQSSRFLAELDPTYYTTTLPAGVLASVTW